MSKYVTIKFFTDLQDNNHVYNVGDPYPRDGVVVSPKRIEELSTNKNRRGVPLIKLVEEAKRGEENFMAEPIEVEAVEEKPVPKRKRGR